MQYTKRTLIVSQSRVSEAEARVARQRQTVETLADAHHPADNAVALLLIMEQSLLAMAEFLYLLEQDVATGERPSFAELDRAQLKRK